MFTQYPNLLGIYQRVTASENAPMELAEHRKNRLRELMDHTCEGKIAELARRIERSDNYVSRMLYPVGKPQEKPIADKMQRVIEAAFALPRGWFDMPMGTALPGQTQNTPIRLMPASDPGLEAPRQHNITWPFKRVSYRRITELQKTLGYKQGQEAINDIDKYLDIAVMKWEREALAVKS